MDDFLAQGKKTVTEKKIRKQITLIGKEKN